ncbi:MAG: TonB-dependent receptor [Ignavibacteria bacterium]|nr:TonB-dependent receptor [Ignavibacteria bacterium]
MNRIMTILFLLLLLPAMALAQSGKLRGQITDQETGEALIGANIIIVGTSYGAATDVNGEYIILNLVAGTYEVKASYIGYQANTISNVRINADLTTGLDFQLAAEGIQVGTVEVVAERPLINKYNTNANRITTSEDIEALPIRGVDNILAVTPGVVLQDNQIFIRGGRQDEVGFYLEGSNITDPMVGGRQITLVQEALEEINVQSGGYNAEYGNANSGIIRQQIKSGTPDWKFSLEYITDNIGFNGSDDHYSGNKSLGSYWFGYNESVFTLSGPLGMPNIKFFGLFNYNFMRDPNPQPLDGFNLGRIGDPATGDTLDFVYPAGAKLSNWNQNYTGTASFTLDFNPAIFRLVGTYTKNDFLNPWPATRNVTEIGNFINTARTENVEAEDGAFSLKYTHIFSANSFLEVSGGLSFQNLNRFDPYLKDNWLSYGDSVANANVGWIWDRSRDPIEDQNKDRRYQRPTQYNIFIFNFFDTGDVVASYQKFNRQNLNFSAAFSSQITKQHNLKIGGEYQMWNIANFSFNNERIMLLPGKIDADSKLPDTDPNKIGDVNKIIRREGVNNFGYDPMGIKTDDGIPDYEKARKPNFLGVYVQDRIEYNDLIINAGLRFDRIDIDNWVPINIYRPELTWNKQTKDVIPSGVVQTEAKQYVSPRLGFSFPVTDQTIFHAQWGKFVQQSRLRDVYQGLNFTGINLTGGFFLPAPVGFDVRPTRTTQYEVGFTQQIGEFASVDITGFYKDIQDQVVYSQVIVAAGSPFGNYYVLQNGDVATTKGIEIAYNMRRIERFKVDGNITFTDAKGTGSFPNSNRGIVGAPIDALLTPNGFSPQYISPLEFNQAIRAALNLDFRFGKGDGGPVFQELGITLLGTYSSGHPFTRGTGGADLEGDARDRQPLEPLNNSTTPSTFQVDMRLDKTFDIADLFDLNIYFYVINLFDTRNVYNVFLRTGSADDDGYLSDPNLGGQQIATWGQDFVDLYSALNLQYHQQWYAATTGGAYTTQPSIFGPPRQIRFGIRIEY